MTVRSYIFGNAVYWDETCEIFRYEWDDIEVGTIKKKCPLCKKFPTKEGYDPCLGYIPGAKSVCCGHGIIPPKIER